MRILTLPLKALYFHEIAAGTKPFEYRLATPYWRTRLADRSYDFVMLMLAYPRRDDETRRMLKPWRGCLLHPRMTHPFFGLDEVAAFAIDVTGPSVPLWTLHGDVGA